MNYPALNLKFLISFALLVFIFSCNPKKNKEYNVTVTQEDSARLSDVEYHVSFGNFDSAIAVIEKYQQLEDYEKHKIFRLKLLENKVRLYIKIKKFQLALDNINKIIAETEYDREHYNNQFVGANLLKGDIYFGLGNYRTAYNYYYIGKESSKGLGENCAFAMYDYRISLILYRQNKYLEAAKNFKKSYTKYRECNNNDFWVNYRKQEILSNIGLCFFKLKNYDSSLYYYNRALSYLNTIPANTISHKISLEVADGVINGNIGKVYITLKQYDKAIPLLKKNIEINSRIKYDNLDAITSIIALGTYYLEHKQYNQFKYIMDLPVSYYTNPNYREQILYVYELKSRYYEELNDLKSALQNYRNYEALKDSISLEKQRNNDSDVQLSIESLERENQLNKLTKESQQRKFYIYIGVYITIGLLILIVTVSIFLRISNRKNLALKLANEEVNAQKELLKKANEEITYSNDVLKQKDLEKNKILSIVAHDLRNPTNAINSIATTLKQDKNLTEEQLEFLNLIEVSAKSSNDLIQEVLYFAKPGQFETKNEYTVCNCNDLLKQTVSLNMFRATKKHIQIVLEKVNPALYINCNAEKIRRAISNILVNAIKFSHHNANINIYTSHTEDLISIHIQDFGIGIPDRIKDSIFDSDPIIRRTGTDGEASFGLGLAIVKQIAEEHNGKVSFISNMRGTTFSLDLPLHKINSTV
jgi:two-component system sensor histidine kinase VicK